MAFTGFRQLDTTGNEGMDRTYARLNRMLKELYAGAVNALTLGSGTKTAAATAGAATLNTPAGTITSEALTTAAAASYTLTLTNSSISASSKVMVSVANGTNTQGVPVLSTVKPGAGSATIVVANLHATQALNGTLAISYAVIN